MKCPKCGFEATNKDFDNNTSILDYWIDIDGNWNWECFNCNHKWIIKKEVDKK